MKEVWLPQIIEFVETKFGHFCLISWKIVETISWLNLAIFESFQMIA